MAEHRWEWTLPGGARVVATLEPTAGTESVLVDGRVVSKGARGATPNGHVFPLPGAAESEAEKVVVSFDPRLLICILRVGREEIAPTLWPAPRAAKTRPPPSTPMQLRTPLVLLAVIALVGVAGYMLATRSPPSDARAPMTGVHRADNGLFVAHFPTSFVARAALVPGGTSGVVLEDRARNEAVVILATTLAADGVTDPWELQKRAHGEALANLPRGGGAHEETSRTDGTCVGQPGAIVLGRVTSTSGARANLWSCAFRRGPAGYLVMFATPENAPGGAARLAAVVEATELTQLEQITGTKP
jgi:hypothetical protein